MKIRLHFFAAITALASAFLPSPTKADLILSGNLVGVFQSSDNPNTVISNSVDGDTSFRTGVAISNSFQSGVNFNGESFSNLMSGDALSLGMFTYYNGITKIGTSSGSAVLDLYLELTDPESSPIHLTTMTFGIDATTNTFGNLIADNYTVSYTQPSEAWIGGEWVKFSLSGLPAVTSVAEDTWSKVGSLTFTAGATVVPVSEGGVTGLFLVLGLVAIITYRSLLRSPAVSQSRSATG